MMELAIIKLFDGIFLAIEGHPEYLKEELSILKRGMIIVFTLGRVIPPNVKKVKSLEDYKISKVKLKSRR